MNKLSFHHRKLSSSRVTLVVASLALLASAAALPFLIKSCAAKQGKPDDPAVVERMRAMTRGGVLPAESVVAGIEREYAGSRTGALARLLHARVLAAANNFVGAAQILDSRDVRERTAIADHALFLRAGWLAQANRRVEARAAYEKLARDFPDSTRAREATLRGATMTLEDGQAAAVPTLLKKLADDDDPQALLLTAKAYEQTGDRTRALGAYRRLYFYVPSATDAESEAASALSRLNSTTVPANAEEAITRAEKMFAARHYGDRTADAYADAFTRFPETATPQARLHRGVSAFHARKNALETVNALKDVPPTAGETRAEALHYIAQHYARERNWQLARTTLDELRRAFPKSAWTMRAHVATGQAARDAKNTPDAFNFYRAAVSSFPGQPEVAGAQFELAWAAHESKNFAESSRLLIEHLANYADRNTDNRGRAGYWAARDSERAGRAAEAHALYEAMQDRYDANWYGYLSKQRLDAMARGGQRRQADFAPDSAVGRAAANLRYVTVAEETAGPETDAALQRADQLHVVGLDDLAHAELDRALQSAPASPRLNLAKARVHRSNGENLEGFRVLARSFPDYSQMDVEEMTTEEWDVFYPLAHWDAIREESRARSLDPYTVAGLIRQESVFHPRAVSPSDAYGLMQLLPSTARMMARRVGVERAITTDALFEPRLNIQLGTAYLREQLDRFGRIEYVAAAYNAGPGRAVTWRATLPAEIDEWAEAVPFRETRGYIQGVVRNTAQYRRLYDDEGRFRAEVGTRAASRGQAGASVRTRRVANDDEEEE